jgi:hypothetical protein
VGFRGRDLAGHDRPTVGSVAVSPAASVDWATVATAAVTAVRASDSAQGPLIPGWRTGRQYPSVSSATCPGGLRAASVSWPAHPVCSLRPPAVGRTRGCRNVEPWGIGVGFRLVVGGPESSESIHAKGQRCWQVAGQGLRRVVGSINPSRRPAPRFRHLSVGVSRTGSGTC